MKNETVVKSQIEKIGFKLWLKSANWTDFYSYVDAKEASSITWRRQQQKIYPHMN